MKSITVLALVLIVVSALSSQPFLGAARAVDTASGKILGPAQVVDTSGQILRAGANYYIVHRVPCGVYERYCTSKNGGGLSLASIGGSCPLDVVALDGYRGMPLTFTPVYSKKGGVRVSTDLNIMFSTHRATTRCGDSNVWKLDDQFDYTNGQWFVTTGGVLGNPGWRTLRNWFKIEEYDGAYKIVYCPDVCPSCKHLCNDVGVFEDQDGNKRLALSDVPFKVKFQLA